MAVKTDAILTLAIALVAYHQAGGTDAANLSDRIADLGAKMAEEPACWKQLVTELSEVLGNGVPWSTERINARLCGEIRGPLTPYQTQKLGEGLDYLTRDGGSLPYDLDDLITDLAADRCCSLDQFANVLINEDDEVIDAVVAVMLAMPPEPAA